MPPGEPEASSVTLLVMVVVPVKGIVVALGQLSVIVPPLAISACSSLSVLGQEAVAWRSGAGPQLAGAVPPPEASAGGPPTRLAPIAARSAADSRRGAAALIGGAPRPALAACGPALVWAGSGWWGRSG